VGDDITAAGRVAATRFAIVPEWLLDAEVDDRAIRLYAILRRYADREGRAHPGRRRLAERLRCSESTLDRTIRQLVAAGAVVVRPRYDEAGDRTSNDYLLADRPPAPVTTGGVTDDASGGVVDAASGGVTDDEAGERIATRNESHFERKSAPPSPATPSPVNGRARDLVWEAMLDACAIDPASITPAARKAYNRARQELRAAGAEPADVHLRARNYRHRFRDVALTPTALARHWAECATVGPARLGRGTTSTALTMLERMRQEGDE